MIIYKITNLLNGKVYIGQTRRPLTERWKGHCKRRKDGRVLCITKAILKYGKQNFKIEEIAKANSLQELNKLETLYIAVLNSLAPNGYNLETGGGVNKKFSEITLQKMSEGQKRRFARDGAARSGMSGKLSPRSKPVLCITTGKVYESARQAALDLNVPRSHVNTIARGGGKEFRRSTNGYKFIYVDLIKESA